MINVFSFMTVAQVADVRGFTYTQNVTDALRAASSYVERSGGGTLLLPKGGYLVGNQTFQGTLLDGVTPCAYGPEEIVTIRNCANPLKISGYGAVLKAAAGLKYGSFDRTTGNRYDPPALPFLDYNYYSYPYRGMLNLEGNASVAVEGLELDGNNALLSLGGYWGDSQWQLEGHGIVAVNNGSVLIQDVHAHHQPCDGIVLKGATPDTDGSVPKPIKVQNVRSRFNGRQGISLVGGKSVRIDNCDLSQTGQALNTVSNEMVRSSPGCGMDIEAESTVIRDVLVSNTTMIGNWSRGISANTGDSRRLKFSKCKIEYISIARPEYVFEDCTLIGFNTIAEALTDQYKATSSDVTLTVAGSGPFTITRNSGSFVTDGFAVGNVVQLSGGLNADNKIKNLTVIALTGTVMTVTVNDGTALVEEGPIAGCTVGTALTAKDSSVFRRCNFTYDASLTESGTLVDAAQSLFDEAIWCRFIDCVWSTGSVNLPSFNIFLPSVGEASPLFVNCRFLSSSTAPVNIAGRFQGYNYINHGGTPSLFIGTKSRIESGDVIENGVSQARSG